MALPLPSGLTPSEVAFLCEMELVTIIPRQRLEGLELLGVRLNMLLPLYESSTLTIDESTGTNRASDPSPTR